MGRFGVLRGGFHGICRENVSRSAAVFDADAEVRGFSALPGRALNPFTLLRKDVT